MEGHSRHRPIPLFKLALLAAFFLGGLGARLYWASRPLVMQGSDEGSYQELAVNLAEHDAFAASLPDGSWKLTGEKPPGVPFLVSLVYRVTGPSLRAGRSLIAFLGACLSPAVFLLGSELFGEEAGLWAAAIVAFHPLLIYWSGLVMTEIPFALLLILGLWLEAKKTAKASIGFLSGLLWGCSCLVRSTGSYLALGAVAVRLWRTAVRGQGRAALAAFLIGLFLLPFAWARRNRVDFGRYALDYHGGWSVVTTVMFHKENMVDTSEADKALRAEPWYPQAADLGEAQQDAFFMAKAKEWAWSHPKQLFLQGLDNAAQFWRLYPRQDKPFPHARLLFAVSLGAEGPLYLLTLVGLWRRRAAWSDWLPLVLCAAILTAIHGLTAGQMRYRIPLTPLMAVFAGTALARGAVRGEG